MEKRHTLTTSVITALAAALALTACDRTDSGRTAATSPASTTPPATTTGSTMAAAGDKMAATTDKVATAVDDTAITTKVKAALLAEPGLKSLKIDVDTKNAAVTLSGSVDSAASKEKAKQVAGSVSGVTTVVDQLTVKS
jgi:hyperosmotically inducible protein